MIHNPLSFKSHLKVVWLLAFLLFCGALSAQNITVSGHMYEKGSRESLPGGLVYDPVSQKFTNTNSYGFYSLTLPYHDGLFLVFNNFGYVNDTLRITAAEDREYDAYLSKVQLLETVDITAEKTSTEQV